AAALPCLVQLLGGEDRRGEVTDHDGVVDRREVRGPYPQVQAEIALSTVRVDQAHRLASDFGGRLRNCQREGGLALPALPGQAGDHFGGGGAAPAASGGTGLGDVIQCGIGIDLALDARPFETVGEIVEELVVQRVEL